MYTKFTLLLVCGFLFHTAVFAQAYTHVYYMNESFASVDKSKAIFTCKGYQDSTGFKLDCFANTNDLLALSCYFTDATLATLQGSYQQYYAADQLQTQGLYQDNQKQGVWEDWDEEGRKTDSTFYENGVRLRYTHYDFYTNINIGQSFLTKYEMKDTLADTFDKYYFSDSGELKGKVHFVGNDGIYEQYEKGQTIIDTVFSREEKEAVFPGGNQGWTKYVQRTLGTFNPGEVGAGNGVWKVIVKFRVDTNGSITEVTPETNFGFQMEEKVVEMITKGPKWLPENRFGKLVKAYRRQPVTFVVSGL